MAVCFPPCFLISSQARHLALGCFSFCEELERSPYDQHYNGRNREEDYGIRQGVFGISTQSNDNGEVKDVFYCYSADRHRQQQRQMGSQICRRDNLEPQLTSLPFEYQFEEDDRELRITHHDSIVCRSINIERNIRDCEMKLRKSQKLYKDKSMRTEPILLKSKEVQDTEVKCTFQRPYVFLSNSAAGRGEAFRLYNKQESSSSQIIVKDRALQYFGVFLCFVADHPQLLDDIFLTQANNYGIHCLSMNANSIRQPIYIDDYILCYQRLPFFSQPVRGKNAIYLWPCILEKAWVKVNGSIAQAVRKVEPQEVFRAFLSYPMKTYSLEQKGKDQSHDRTADTHNLNMLHTLYGIKGNQGCIITTKAHPKHKIGISNRKNFYFLKSFEIEGTRYYYFRDPCARALDFRGKHSHLEESIKEQIKRHIELNEDERLPQGNFLLEQDEALEQLESFLVIHFEPTSSVVTEQVLEAPEEKESFVEFQLPERGYVSLSIHQSADSSKAFPPTSFLIIHGSQVVSDLKNIEGSFGARVTQLLPQLYKELPAGKYLARVLRKRNPARRTTSTAKLVFTAPFSISATQRNQPQLREKYEEFLKQQGRKRLGESDRRRKVDFQHVGYWLGDLAVVFVRRSAHLTKDLKLQVGFPELKNLRCISHPNISSDFVVLERVGQQLLLIFEKIDLTAETRLGKYVIESF